MNTKNFYHEDWVKIWEGRWCILTCCDFGDQYTGKIFFTKKPFQSQSIIFNINGRSSAWMRQKDKDMNGGFLSEQVRKNPKKVNEICSNLKSQAKSIIKFINENENSTPSLSLYEEFCQRILAYYYPHISVKYVVDYLDTNLLKKHLPKFEAARLAAEPVFGRSEDFIINFAKNLSKKTKYSYKSLLCLTNDELINYFRRGKLPDKVELDSRSKKSMLLFEKGRHKIFTGKEIKEIKEMEKALYAKPEKSEVKGSIAFPGKIKGIVRIVGDPTKAKNFKVGDILVTGMTRPDFLSLMHKAGAFVTDAGGILSHAAIVARELKKPCVIGTMISTKVFKDGDVIEVDANKGIVRKI